MWAVAPSAATMAAGRTMVVVPKGNPGVSLEDTWDPMGMRPTISWSLRLDDVFVPFENVLGQPGDWVQWDQRTFTLAYTANHLGTAHGVFDFTQDFARQRPFLMDDVATTLGEMDAGLQASRRPGLAKKLEAGSPDSSGARSGR